MTQPQTQLDRIEAAVGRCLLALQTLSTKETAIMSEQDQVAADTSELVADAATFDQFRTDVEAFIAAHPGLDLTELQAAVDKVHASAGAQAADEPAVGGTPPATS